MPRGAVPNDGLWRSARQIVAAGPRGVSGQVGAGPRPVSAEQGKLGAGEGVCRGVLAAKAPVAGLTGARGMVGTGGVSAGWPDLGLARLRASVIRASTVDMAGLDRPRFGQGLTAGARACAAGGPDAPCAGPLAVPARGDMPVIDRRGRQGGSHGRP